MEYCEKVMEEEGIKIDKKDKGQIDLIDFIQTLRGEKKIRKFSMGKPRKSTQNDQIDQNESADENTNKDDDQMEVSTQELRNKVKGKRGRKSLKKKRSEEEDDENSPPNKKTKRSDSEEDDDKNETD